MRVRASPLCFACRCLPYFVRVAALPQATLRARSDAHAHLSAAAGEAAEARASLRSTQAALEECRALLAAAREEKVALSGRLGRLEAAAHSYQHDAEAVLAEKQELQRDLARVIRSNDALSAQLDAAGAEVERLRARAAAAAVAADVAASMQRRGGGGGGGDSINTPSYHDASSAPRLGGGGGGGGGGAGGSVSSGFGGGSGGGTTLLRIERGDVVIGDGVQSITRGEDGSTTLRSAEGAEVHVSASEPVRVDVKPAPYLGGDDWGASPRRGLGLGAGGLLSARSHRSGSEARSPSPGVSRLQERLKRVQATFAQLRDSAATSASLDLSHASGGLQQ